MRSLCVLLLSCAVSFAAPPSFSPPEQVPIFSGVAVYQPPPDCVSVRYIGLDGEEEFPLDLVGGSKTAFAFIARGLPPGKTYRFVGVASSATGEQVEKTFAVTIPTDGAPPPKKPVDPPPVTGKTHFVVVRVDGPASAEHTRIMSLPAWKEAKAKGIVVNDYTMKQAKQLNLVETGFYVLLSGPEKSIVQRGPIPVPSTDAEIRKFFEGL